MLTFYLLVAINVWAFIAFFLALQVYSEAAAAGALRIEPRRFGEFLVVVAFDVLHLVDYNIELIRLGICTPVSYAVIALFNRIVSLSIHRSYLPFCFYLRAAYLLPFPKRTLSQYL